MNGMMESNGPSWVSQSLDAGILAAILQSAPRLTRSSKLNSSRCSSLLSNILCQYLVYKSVVRSAAKGLRKVERLELDGGLGGPIWEAWAIFQTLVSERIAIKKRSSQSIANRKACGRMDCRASTDHDELLRCGGCLKEFYCNKECQRMDWSSHKSSCQKLQQMLQDGIEADISPADRGFIGDIIATEIMENGKSLEKLITALDSSPFPERTPSDFVFSFDYTKVPVSIRVIPVAKLNDGKEFWKADWDPLLKQALLSNGKCAKRRTGRFHNVFGARADPEIEILYCGSTFFWIERL
ncbi:hypothetical protein FIBSPDRAFT_929063 [Athelia psychrophila]|uniref:MYND-type domain-containing protein n=1 Tax=Athelia psychrophila TaxID=1759441 RepID=A0A166P9L6_9AGAM|nr:hypothetical protein FIBSPDRAFT_929063 [Fibularhizoctonia sp. CBS 109695]